MRLSEFQRALADEFGERYGQTLLRDLALTRLGSLTGEESLTRGVSAREVWLALCEEMGVPEQRRHGAGRPEPRR